MKFNYRMGHSMRSSEMVAKDESGIKIDTDGNTEPKLIVTFQISPNLLARWSSCFNSKTMDASLSTALASAWEDEKETNIRVAYKEEAVNIGMSFLKRLIPVMEKHVAAFPKCQEWIDQSETIINKAEVPRVLIGVLGYTGSGKSSLINALVDEEMVLPCNAMRASTSAVVELSWNRSENPTEKYAAEIEFITPEEWMSEIEILAHDIKNRPEGEQLGIKSGNEASIAYAKLAAVYPGVEITKLLDMSPEQLHEEQDLSEILGKKTKVHEATPKKFSALINAYIDSSNKNGGGQGAYWPLVRLVKVFIKAPLLQNGLVLVDLPGLGDSNAGRANVAEKFIQNLHHIWVVADIVRAIDDSVAKELLGRSFKRQLLMEGRYDDDFVTFIMTKTDQINSMEVIRSLQGQDEALNEKLEGEIEQREALAEVKSQLEQLATKCKQIEKVLKKLNKEKKGLGGDVASKSSPVRKRKFEERDEIEGASNKPGAAIANSRLSDIKKERQSLLEAQKACRNDEKELTAKADQIEKVLANLKVAVDTQCIAARNRYTQSHLQIDFEGGLLELKQELMQLDEDGLTKLAKTSKAQATSQTSLKSFCVSSKAYQSLSGRFKRAEIPRGFPDLDHTQIPQLQDFAQKSTLGQREVIADELINSLNLMNGSIKVWAENRNASCGLSEFQKTQLQVVLDQHLQALEKTSREALVDMMSHFHRDIDQYIGSSLKTAVCAGPRKAAQLCKNISFRGLAPNTWKAICTRKGYFPKSKKLRYDWNQEFADILLEPLAIPWGRVLNEQLLELYGTFSITVIQSLREFSRNLEESVAPICGPSYQPLKGILSQILLLEKQVQSKIAESQRLGKEAARNFPSVVKRLVLNRMRPVYRKCKEESGSGMGARMKAHLSDHIEKHSDQMYTMASEIISENLKKMADDILIRLAQASLNARDKLSKDVQQMLEAPLFQANNMPVASVSLEVQKMVMAEIENLEKAWKEALENPRGQNKDGNSPIKEGHSMDIDRDSDSDDGSDDDDDDDDDDNDDDMTDDENEHEDSEGNGDVDEGERAMRLLNRTMKGIPKHG